MFDKSRYWRKVDHFELPKTKIYRSNSVSFLDRKDLETDKHVFVFYKHFTNHFVKKQIHQDRLICSKNLFPTILPASCSTTNVSEAEFEQLKTNTERKPPTARVLQSYELQILKQMETIQDLEDIDNTCLKSLGEGFNSLNKKWSSKIFQTGD